MPGNVGNPVTKGPGAIGCNSRLCQYSPFRAKDFLKCFCTVWAYIVFRCLRDGFLKGKHVVHKLHINKEDFIKAIQVKCLAQGYNAVSHPGTNDLSASGSLNITLNDPDPIS